MTKKRLVVCMDGTWQNLATAEELTNVSKIALAVKPEVEGIQQLVFYSPGIGAEAFLGDTQDRIFKGAVGEGAEEAIVSAYLFLSLNYQPGDEIFLFGFSRGAFCVRSLGGLMSACGLIDRRNARKVKNGFDLYRVDKNKDRSIEGKRLAFRKQYCIEANPTAPNEADRHRPPIRYIGVFETVVMRGLPNSDSKNASTTSKQYGFHNLMLGDHVHSARHALALDERRNSLRPTPWTNLNDLNKRATWDPRFPNGWDPLHPDAPFQQKWFTGAHGDVGGGMDRPLSLVSRKWVKRGAWLAGLRFRDDDEPLDIGLNANKTYDFLDGKIEVPKGALNILGLKDREAFPELIEPSRADEPIEVQAQRVAASQQKAPNLQDLERLIHVSALLRARQAGRKPAYKSATLAPFMELFEKPRGKTDKEKLSANQTDKEKLISRLCDEMKYPPDQKMVVDKLPGSTPVA